MCLCDEVGAAPKLGDENALTVIFQKENYLCLLLFSIGGSVSWGTGLGQWEQFSDLHSGKKVACGSLYIYTVSCTVVVQKSVHLLVL